MKVLIVDLETGNFDPAFDNFQTENCMICEIGIAGLDLDSGEIDLLVNSVCREGEMCHPSSWVFQNTSLNQKEVEKAVMLDKLRGRIQDLFDQSAPVTSWGHSFDLRLLEHGSRGFRIPLRFWDPLTTLASYIKIQNPFGVGYKWPSVGEVHACLFPDESFSESHRAGVDAIVEARLIYEATRRWPELALDWRKYIRG
jgi:hypothetical protein